MQTSDGEEFCQAERTWNPGDAPDQAVDPVEDALLTDAQGIMLTDVIDNTCMQRLIALLCEALLLWS